jgi:flotillin
MQYFGGLFVPIMILMVVIAILAAVAMVAKRYIRIGPNRCAVIYGRKRTIIETDAAGNQIRRRIGFRTLCGGATFIWPIVEKYSELDLTEKNIPVSTANAITEGGVKLSVDAIANVKIGSDDISLRNAAERLLGKSETDLEKIIQKTLDAHLRSICGNLTIEKINSDRQAFTQKVTSEAAEDLRKLGIIIDNISIEHLSDDQGYLEALGKKRTEEVKRDASIGVAEAQREATIKSTNAHREAEKLSPMRLK